MRDKEGGLSTYQTSVCKCLLEVNYLILCCFYLSTDINSEGITCLGTIPYSYE